METCEVCGTTENIQKHHISYGPEIKQFLCVTCHQKIHGHGVGKAPGWTTLFKGLKEDAEILFKEEATNKEVSKACDISYATASHWRKKLGLGLPQWVSVAEHPNWKGGEKEENKPMMGFHIEQKYKDRVEAIADSFEQETMSDVIEAILKAFFIANKPPRDMEKGRELVIMKRKGEYNG